MIMQRHRPLGRIARVLRAVRCRALLPWLLAVALVGCQGPPQQSKTTQGGNTLSPVRILQSAAAAGFEQATEPRPFVFPADHGPHPGFRTEWWYFVGNLRAEGPEDDAGRDFGFQLTFFRQSSQPQPVERGSEWASRDLYFAHFAVSDIDNGRFAAFERFSRGALGLAGAQAEPFGVWIEDWQVMHHGAADAPQGDADGGGLLPATLEASADDIKLRLELLSSKEPVAIGDGGLSVKSRETGAASHYYSMTRIASRGSLDIAGQTLEVQGNLWLDREWSTSTLAPDQTGWDWFSLQLDDGRDLMFYILRRRDGTPEPASHGVLVDADGTSQHLALEQVEIQVTDHWTSPHGAVYPAAWQLQVAELDLQLDIVPRLADQELRLTVAYWEGAVSVRGEQGGRSLEGRGYVELVGY